MNKPHIYKITNQIDGKYYYGVHNGSDTDNYMGSGKILKAAQKKYGIENFKKQILMWFETEDEAYEYERVIVNEKMINKNNPMCYNLVLGGGGGDLYSHLTPEQKVERNKKISEKHTGKKYTQEMLDKMSIAQSGENHPMWNKKHSEETINLMSIAHSGENNGMYGRNHSQESKDLMSIAKSGENHPMFGQTHSKETKQKMSESGKGKNKGKVTSQETKDKISKSNQGKTHSEKTKDKMSENNGMKNLYQHPYNSEIIGNAVKISYDIKKNYQNQKQWKQFSHEERLNLMIKGDN